MSLEKYRHEFKYEISRLMAEELKTRLGGFLKIDGNVRHGGQYRIRSLYFDDYDDTGYRENDGGFDIREKFRIRLYDGDASFIRLERKLKESGMTKKTSCRLTTEEVRALIDGESFPGEDRDKDPVLERFLFLRKTRRLEPKVIVEYDRVPFVYPERNVRVTLDMNICAGPDIKGFMDKEIFRFPVLPCGMGLLEVKYDEFIPDTVYRLIQMRDLSQTTFSKYYICRKAGVLFGRQDNR